ncbi:hypothetical protein Tco_0163032 [Tanacetum coccineum]
MHSTNFDQLYVYLRQHEAHANEVRLERQRYPNQIALVANYPSCFNPTQYYPQLSSISQQYYPSPAPQRSYDTPMVHQSQYQPSVFNHSPLVHQQTYQEPALQQSYQAPVIQQPLQPSFHELDTGLVVLTFNPSDDFMANLNKLMTFVTTTFSSRYPPTNNQLGTSSNPRNQATIQDGRVTMVKQGRPFGQSGKAILSRGMLLQHRWSIREDKHKTDDLDAFDSDYDEVPSAKVVLNLSSYDSDVILKVLFHNTHIEDDMSYQSMQETQCSEQPFVDNNTKIDITSDSNIISYEQYLQETETLVVQSTSSPAHQDALIMSVIEEMSSQVAKCNKVIVDRNAKVADFEKQIHSLKLQLNETVQSHKTLSTTAKCLKKESKQKEDKYLDEIINLQKKKKALDNVRKAPTLYDSHNIVKTHVALSVPDTEETLELAEESKGVEHIKGAFEKDEKPFAQTLKGYFQLFDLGLNKELKEMKAVFNQMKIEVAKCSADKKYFEIEIKELCLDNDRLLEHIICQDVINVVMHADVHNVLSVNTNCLDKYNIALEYLKHEYDQLMEVLISQDLNLKLQTELDKKNDMIENVVYNELSKRCSRLENRSVEKVKKDIDEIKIINIGLEHSVAKLLFKNENLRKEREHLKSIYKDQFDSIKKARVRSKEHSDSLIAQINAKSVKNSDLNAQLQEKVLAIAALKNKLRKLKGKTVVDNVVSTPIATQIALNVSKFNLDRYTKVTKAVKFNDTPSLLGTKPSNIMEPNKIWGSTASTSPSSSRVNFRSYKSYSGTVRFGNDQIAKIMGYGDYQLGNVTISRFYYVKGLGHNLFYVGQFCDSDLEVAFRKHTCFIRNLDGVELISGSRDTNLYTISLDDMLIFSDLSSIQSLED